MLTSIKDDLVVLGRMGVATREVREREGLGPHARGEGAGHGRRRVAPQKRLEIEDYGSGLEVQGEGYRIGMYREYGIEWELGFVLKDPQHLFGASCNGTRRNGKDLNPQALHTLGPA